MSDERPDGWNEPVHEALLRPASFYGAAPRRVMLFVYAATALVMIFAGMLRFWALMGVALLAASLIQILTASLSYLEPHWFDLLVDWLRSPQSRVDP